MIAANVLFLIGAMADELSDDELWLIRAVATANKAAFEKLFRLYHPRIYTFSMRILQDHQRAEEVVCDTLFAVWSSAHTFREQSKVSTWILGIAYKRALKTHQRHSRFHSTHQSDATLEDVEEQAPGNDPETYVNSTLEGHQVMAALATLSADHRAVLELVALGHSVSEIAEITECPENTVKTRTFHARRKLRAALQEPRP